MDSQRQEYEIINHELFSTFDEEVVQYKLDIYQKQARHLWAMVILLAQAELGVRPDWKKKR